MTASAYRMISYAAAIARHLAANDVDAANQVVDQVHQEGLGGQLVRAIVGLVCSYGERLLGSWDALEADLTDISVKMALAAERTGAEGDGASL